MKVAYLQAFKFNLTSHCLKTLPYKLADDHDIAYISGDVN